MKPHSYTPAKISVDETQKPISHWGYDPMKSGTLTQYSGRLRWMSAPTKWEVEHAVACTQYRIV